MRFEQVTQEYKKRETLPLSMETRRSDTASDVSLKLPYQEEVSNQNLAVLQRNLERCLTMIEDEVMKGYITRLSSLPIAELKSEIIESLQEIHFFRVTELVYQENEFTVHKLSTIFHALSNKPCTLVMMVKSDGIKNEFYMGVRSLDKKNSSGTMMQMLKQSLLGLFPGSKINRYYDEDMKKDMQQLHPGCISSVTCVADYKQEKEEVTNQDFIQGLEKFIYSMQGRAYTAFFLADNLSYSEMIKVRQEYEKIYTLISPFANMQLNFSVNSGGSSSNSQSEGKSQSTTYGISEGSNQTLSYGNTETKGENKSSGTSHAHGTNTSMSKGKTDTEGHSDGTTHTVSDGHTEGKFKSTSIGGQIGTQGGVNGGLNAAVNVGIKILGAAIGGCVGACIASSISVSSNATEGKSSSDTHTISDGTSRTDSVSHSLSKTLSHGINDTDTVSRNTGESRSIGNSVTYVAGTQQGNSYSVGDAFNLVTSRTLTDTFGSSQGITLNAKDMTLQAVMDKLEQHLKRLNECESLGMWNFAAYFLGDSAAETETAANTYQSVVSGLQSGIERAAVNTWIEEEQIKQISKYIQNFIQPFFIYKDFSYEGDRAVLVNPSALVSTNELAIHMGLPRHSVQGLPVVEHAVFGQEILKKNRSTERKIHIGNIFHLGQRTDMEVDLDVDSLSMHTFITGSTGSGKSNTVYQILRELKRQHVQFLVIEPAKGEYKHVFGKENVNIFGTNPEYTPLLKINPFKFAQGIHVLEHIDRLISIFNVCWPMYAAMPAVLKEAVEKAYESAGWDLDTSKHCLNTAIFPCFKDVLQELRNVIRESDYSQEVKDNYTGSLITRVKSLTNGLNGKIFVSNETDNKKLFDESTIIDLSRVGSGETKAMIMGILTMRLQEYRMSQGGMNMPLKHVTVLEEAHNLLKKTSTEQSSESANLAGKSVEMIANAIAEMRTWGEGFVIVDQAPGLLDMSVIRNTNTKLLLRLPELSDRELAGRSVGLDDSQLKELMKLPTGVAVVYQNDWLESVLCSVKYDSVDETEYVKPESKYNEYSVKRLKEEIIQYILSDISEEEPEKDAVFLKDRLLESSIKADIRIQLLQLLDKRKHKKLSNVYDIVSRCFDLDIVFGNVKKARTMAEWNEYLLQGLDFEMKSLSTVCQQNILECIIRSRYQEEGEEHYRVWMEYMGRKVS